MLLECDGKDDAGTDEDLAADDDSTDGGASLASGDINCNPVQGENEGEDCDDGD